MSADALTGFLQAGVSLMNAGASYHQGNLNAGSIRDNARAQANALSYNAGEIQRESLSEELLLRRQNRTALSKQTAAQAQAGVSGSGTALNVLDQSLVDSEADALTIMGTGNRRADAMRFDAQNVLAAGLNEAATAKSAGRMGAAAHLASSAASLYGVYRKASPAKSPLTPSEKFAGYDLFRLSPYLSGYTPGGKRS